MTRATELAEAHWSYVEGVMRAHDLPEESIRECGFHYRSAFVHGWKHSAEEAAKEATDAP